MSDLLSDLPRPPRAPTWRDRVGQWAEALDLTPTRLVLGLVGLLVVGFVGWKLMAPPAPPPEMRLPFVSTTVAGEGGAVEGSRPASSGSSTSTERPPSGEVVVHVAGAVAAPGVHRLDAGARVVDAVDAAGGAGADADVGRLNLAALLEDGQQVYVPRVGEDPPPPVGGAGSPSGAPGGASGSAGGDGGEPVDLNTATVEQLDALPGIGPSIAQAIVGYRDEHGPFGSVDQLIDVRGIGEAKLEELRPLVTV